MYSVKVIIVKSKKLILLTGAGFTCNFGGFTASEVWTRIFNFPAVKTSDKLTARLKGNFDFESIYGQVMATGEQDEKKVIQEAIAYAYETLDASIVNRKNGSSSLSGMGSFKFIELFKGTREEKGLIFTLNQDLFMERENATLFKPIGSPNGLVESLDNARSLREDGFRQLPSSIDEIEKEFAQATPWVYMKLHGSYGWLSADGSRQLVIGKNKKEQIDSEPLLKFSYEVFDKAIQEGGKKMVIAGYSFRDKHINDLLIKGIYHHGLRLFVVDILGPKDFKARLCEGLEPAPHEGMQIWEGIDGYFPYTFEKLFPDNQPDESVEFKELKRVLG